MTDGNGRQQGEEQLDEQTTGEPSTHSVSRRWALKSLGAAGSGNLIGTGAVTAEARSDETLDIGERDTRVDVFAESIDTEILSTSGRLTRNQPTNLDNLAAGDSFAAFKSGDTNYTLVLQLGDDDASEGEAGYAATVQYVTESGERIATTAADKVHNHWGVYTRGSDFDGVDRQPEKRLSVGGGSEVVDVSWQNVSSVLVKPRLEGESAFTRYVPEAGNDAGIAMYQGTGDLASTMHYDGSRDTVRIQNYAAETADFLELRATGEIDNHGHEQENLVIENGTSSERPAAPEHAQQYFDDDLGKPIWYDENAGSWIDATGEPV